MDTAGLRVDGARLWASLMRMAEIGATPAGGCNRQALTPLDKAGRDLFCDWARELGCEIRIDAIGNIFARRAGRDPAAAPVMTGSHLDTQPTGGKFDGVYGVLAGLEVLRTLEAAGHRTLAPLEVVVWTNEEGARLSPAMLGSGVWAGVFGLEEAWAIRDKAGCTVREALEGIAYRGETDARSGPVHAAFEVHIEQGPILEAEGLGIGILTGVQGMRWYDLTLRGRPCHAGPTPMEGRRDPFMALGPIQHALYALAARHAPWARVTFGDIRVAPGVRNTVPETLVLAVDLRHPDPEVLATMDREFHAIAAAEAARVGLGWEIRLEWDSPAVVFHPRCVDAVAQAVERLGYPAMHMVSGAGHDSVYVSRVAPTGMIFVPCGEGISHNEAESANPGELEAGANVLLHAMLQCADAPQN